MKPLLILFCAVTCFVLPAVAGADGGVSPETSTASIATTGHLVLPVRPDGAGPAFSEAFAPGGFPADATITAVLRDNAAFPIAAFPREDTWLQTADGDLVACGGALGLLPDGGSDIDGIVRWTAAPAAGGYGSGGVYVFVNGMALAMVPLTLDFVSPDFDADGQVNLTDGGMFTGILYVGYAPRGDFNNDGSINLVDVAQMTAGLGTRCP